MGLETPVQQRSPEAALTLLLRRQRRLDSRSGRKPRVGLVSAVRMEHRIRTGRDTMIITRLIAAIGALSLLASQALAEDVLKVALPQHGAWDAGLCELGERAGIFKKY